MAGAKEIRTQIKSIQNTRKITRAMEMVAASKMRKAQQRMREARPYAEKVRNVVSHLSYAHSEYRHPYLMERETKRIGLMIVSTDRGLCGGLNINLFRSILLQMAKWDKEGFGIDLCTFGKKSVGFFKRMGCNIHGEISQLGDAPSVMDVIGVVKIMLDAYSNGEIDRLYIAYNRFVSSMSQQPIIEPLLPIKPEAPNKKLQHYWDYIYEPDAVEVLDHTFMRYIESLVYRGLVENIASAQAARMVAMKSASDNAQELIDELQLIYNKARQAAITQEISEIVSGAAAV